MLTWLMKPSVYEIVIEGELGPRLAGRFAPMRVEARDGTTTLVGEIRDQAELKGLLDLAASLGLALVSVNTSE
jgi:hypothetical protein